MKIFFTLGLVIFLISTSCIKKNEGIDTNIPTCIKTILNDNDSHAEPIKKIRIQKVNGILHYWLNTEAMAYDGVEYIVSNSCDTLCIYCGECITSNCTDDYSFDKWTTIWTKQ